ncbi:MAG: ATP-dependent DNA helicase [Candidatus Paceibacterota bacterium]|jgi:DNA helicase-2/ATP-dependent DNA helicase PcrA
MGNLPQEFEKAYKGLNKAQKEAVDLIDGPVMVIAGPGTGKTQILSLRIANILKKTDTGADGILCLTFTNSAVRAMHDRLHKYIGGDASRVDVLTFHKFSAQIIEKFYSVIDFDVAPRVLEDAESVSICDQILRENDWTHIRPRGDIGRYFKELKSLISLLKRERLTPEDFMIEIESEIKNIKENPDNISTRGESKGKMKKEFLSKIESLERTKEIVTFYELYEKKKREDDLMDHDDTIKYALLIVENSEEARAEIREKYLYVLIDEHQDSSGSQNDLLKAIWKKVEKPNIFAVGDDRQLIYAFGGAKMSHFEEFKSMFGKAKIIFLTDNYRSTENILNTADALLSSSFSNEKLVATLKENHNLKLIECDYPREEIIACGLAIKDKLEKNEIDINDCAILVPKNRQVVSAIRVLQDMGIKVARVQNLSLFETDEFMTMLRVLKICTNSNDSVSIAELIIDPIIGIPILLAHEFLYNKHGKNINLQNLLSEQDDLFNKNIEIKNLIEKLHNLVINSSGVDVYGLIQMVGDEVLIKQAKDHEELIRRIEVVRSFLHLALSYSEKDKKNTLSEFVAFIERLQDYGEDIPLAVFQSDEGVKVMTLHGSKGLEFDFVWIAHLDENGVMKGRRRNFKLPESIAERVEEKDELAAKRELYVAITRAKRFCTLSYSRFSYNGQNQELARIVADLSSQNNLFEQSSFSETESNILKNDPKAYVISEKIEENVNVLEELKKMVAKEYTEANVSVSLLNNFFECPRKWYFRNLLKLPEPKSESLEFGNLIHGAIDKILKSKKIPSGKDIEDLVVGDKQAIKIISRWVENRLPNISENRENEKSVPIHDDLFPHLKIYGKIDLVEELSPKDVRVTDFKTGSPRKKSDIERMDEDPAFFQEFGEARGRMSDYMRQLAMYSYLLTKSKQSVNVQESRLEFLEAKDEKETFYDTVIGKEKIDLLINDIKDYDNLVKGGEWFNRPCNFKTYGKIGAECEYCKMAEIYK